VGSEKNEKNMEDDGKTNTGLWDSVTTPAKEEAAE